jgi:hypothetical protein
MVERKERDTGFEPATSTLANWTKIENKEYPCLCRSFELMKTPGKSGRPFFEILNGVEMEYVAGSIPVVFRQPSR